MSFENGILDISFPAAEDLTNDQFRWVILSGASVRRPNSEAEVALGILQNAPKIYEAAVVRVIGVSKLQANDALAVGTFIKAEYVSAADAGKGKDAAGDLAFARGYVVGAAAAEDDLCSVMLNGPYPGITQVAWQRAVVTTEATAEAVTYTIAQLLGGLILRDPNGGARADLLPAPAAIVAGIAGCVVGSSFEFTIRNTADAAETITLTANGASTVSGTATIAQNNSKRFLGVVTNIGSGTEAVVVYSLGTVVH